MVFEILCEQRVLFSIDKHVNDLHAFIFVVTVFMIKGSVHTFDDVGLKAERTVIHLNIIIVCLSSMLGIVDGIDPKF